MLWYIYVYIHHLTFVYFLIFKLYNWELNKRRLTCVSLSVVQTALANPLTKAVDDDVESTFDIFNIVENDPVQKLTLRFQSTDGNPPKVISIVAEGCVHLGEYTGIYTCLHHCPDMYFF